MRFAFIAVLVGLSFIYGVAVGKYQVFPYQQLIDFKYWLTNTNVAQQRTARYKHKVSFFRQNARSNYDVVFVGDSITEGADWDDLFPAKVIANRGIGGDTSSGVLDRIDTVINTKAKLGFIMIGINDIARGITVEQIFINYQNIITQMRQAQIQVVVQSVLFTDGRRHSNQQVARLNQLLKDYCQQHQIQFIQLNQMLAPNDKLGNDFSFDGVHLNGNGYRLWADAIDQLIFSR